MFDLFLEGNKYYDYPSFEVAIFSLLLALALSTVMAFTYRMTYDGAYFSKSLFQGMILSSLVTSMIMMAVGNNLAVGFGIVGAVAIIRFRTNIQSPRNIVFMFAALSIGIATGVYGYAIALAGTSIFCMSAVLLNFSNFRVKATDSYEIECGIDDPEILTTFQSKLRNIAVEIEISDIRLRNEKSKRYTFIFILNEGVDIVGAFDDLRMEGVDDLKITQKKITEQL
ncbi:MAG: putative membrane protein YhiD involved in acid resistance [Cyclobacteriaceae bacterium]|jgi:uncharacterized membrane protein YhiD involved in acid resistance